MYITPNEAIDMIQSGLIALAFALILTKRVK